MHTFVTLYNISFSNLAAALASPKQRVQLCMPDQCLDLPDAEAPDTQGLRRILRKGGWILRSSDTGKRLDVLDTRAIGVDDDEWWTYGDRLPRILSKGTWAILPWGPFAEFYGIVALATRGASTPKYFKKLHYRGEPTLVRAYRAAGGDCETFLGAVLMEPQNGRAVVDRLFAANEPPLMLFHSPLGLESYFDSEVHGDGEAFNVWLRQHLEIVGSVDRTERMNVPWFYRPRDADGFLSLCSIAGCNAPLIASTSASKHEMIRLYESGSYESTALINNIESLCDRFRMLYVTGIGPQDFCPAFLAGSDVGDVVKNAATYHRRSKAPVQALLKL